MEFSSGIAGSRCSRDSARNLSLPLDSALVYVDLILISTVLARWPPQGSRLVFCEFSKHLREDGASLPVVPGNVLFFLAQLDSCEEEAVPSLLARPASLSLETRIGVSTT